MKDTNYKAVIDPNKIPNISSVDIIFWCLDTFGPIGSRWDWYITYEQKGVQWSFYFDRKDDCVQFTLAWH